MTTPSLQSNLWFTSDQHFHHKNIIEYCQRPFSTVEEMNATLIELYRQCVNPWDTVFFLGDVFFGSKVEAEKIISQLPGEKHLIRGNHDRWSDSFYKKLGFTTVQEYLDLYDERNNLGILLTHAPTKIGEPPNSIHEVNFCGHVHEKWRVQGKHYNVGVDQHNFAPVELTEAILRWKQAQG